MRKTNAILFSASLLCCAAASAAAAPGETGGEFLRMLHSPRAVGMGETGAGLYGDLLGAVSLNPAALARTGYREAALAYNSWLEGVSAQQAVYAHPLGGRRGVAAVSVNMLSMPGISGYDNSGAPAGKVEAGDLAAAAHYAVRLSGPWSDRRQGIFSGAAVRYARESLDGVSASAVLFDAGLLWVRDLPAGTLGAGLAAQSLGGEFKFDADSDPAPASVRAGLSFITLSAGDPLTFAADLKKPSGGGSVTSVGAEYQLRRLIALRAGYVSAEDLGSGLRFGAGIAVKTLQFDYAVSSHGDFGAAHRFSLAYKFGKPAEVTPHLSPAQEKAYSKVERARRLMRDSRYYEAVLELNDALGLDPGHPEALELMRKARALVEVSR
ncbi:MAG: PorV/PorQ family protein [Elusimicrobiales bacterium]